MLRGFMFVLVATFAVSTSALAQQIDGILGKQVAINFATAGTTPYAGDVGDIFVISVPAANVTSVATDLLPNQGDAVQRDALVLSNGTIMAFYSAEKVGAANVSFSVTTVVGGVTTVTQKNIALTVSASQAFSQVITINLDGAHPASINANVGDVIEVVKAVAGTTTIASSSGNSSILRRDAVVTDGTNYTYFYTVVGKGSTIIGTSWNTGLGQILPVIVN